MKSYETTDFYLACFLRCVGYELVEVGRDGRRAIFVFRDRPKRREEILAFYNAEGTVSPLAFVGAIRDLKSLIHNT
ncbi:MAG: hypothetical protein KAW17_12500 [Candidatus Eisenbacteria sp.]|nr:hypothetical protein [Candidatus Eisenbacteria bacterium]